MKLQWNQIDWEKAEEQVNRLQVRIVKATLEQKWRLVKRLQYLMTNSFYAKALAVKRVVSNKGKKTPGIDGELWETDKAKMEAVRRLDCRTYHARPLRRIYIEKYGKKEKKPLGIPTMFDRANTSWKSAPFRAGQILNPYPLHCTKAFAFSNILCLLRIVPFLQSAYPSGSA